MPDTDPRTEAVDKATKAIYRVHGRLHTLTEEANAVLDAIDYSATLTALADARRENKRLWEASKAVVEAWYDPAAPPLSNSWARVGVAVRILVAALSADGEADTGGEAT